MKIKTEITSGEINEGLGQFVCQLWQGKNLIGHIITDSEEQTKSIVKHITAILEMSEAIEEWDYNNKQRDIFMLDRFEKQEQLMQKAWDKIK